MGATTCPLPGQSDLEPQQCSRSLDLLQSLETLPPGTAPAHLVSLALSSYLWRLHQTFPESDVGQLVLDAVAKMPREQPTIRGFVAHLIARAYDRAVAPELLTLMHSLGADLSLVPYSNPDGVSPPESTDPIQ